MVATYDPNLRVTEQGNNDNANTWGTVLNQQALALLCEAVAGVIAIDCTGVADVNIATSTVNGGSDTARHAVLELIGLIGNDINLIVPAVEKVYLIRAAQTGGHIINVKPVGGNTSIAFTTGSTQLIYTNGTNIYSQGGTGTLLAANNLSDVANPATALANLGGSAFPPGVLVPYAGSTAPSSWLLCAGQAVSRTTYSALFAVTGTLYGVGDGSATFNLPDMRGRLPAGKDDMGGVSAGLLNTISSTTLGAVGGSQTNTLITANLASHVHDGSGLTTSNPGDHTHSSTAYSPSTAGTNVYGSNAATPVGTYTTGPAGGHTHTITGTTGAVGSATPVNGIPPVMIMNYIIKT